MDSDNKREIKDYVHKRLNRMFDQVLRDVEPAVSYEHTYTVLRRRILRAGNNALRDIHAFMNEFEYNRIKDEDKVWDSFDPEDGDQDG